MDEKKAGTVHVALGDSDSLGGRIEFSIHCDLVVAQPTVYVDGRLVLEAGAWRVDGVDWRLDHRTLDPPEGWWAGVREVRRSGVRTEITGDRLLRQWHSGPGRRDSMPVGTEATAEAAARIYDILPENGGRADKEALLAEAAQIGMD